MDRIVITLALVLLLGAALTAAGDDAPTAIENDTLRVTLNTGDASLIVRDKRTEFEWRQSITPGLHVAPGSLKKSVASLSAQIAGKGGPYSLTLSLSPDCPHGVDLTLEIPDRKYTAPLAYPFPFTAPADWFYVQNTTGEGMLMPLSKPDEIKDLYQ